MTPIRVLTYFTDGEVVGDEEIAHAQAVLDVAQEIHDLGADRHVERRHRLVEQDALGAGRERARERDALALAAGQLVRIVVGDARRQAHALERLRDPRA